MESHRMSSDEHFSVVRTSEESAVDCFQNVNFSLSQRWKREGGITGSLRAAIHKYISKQNVSCATRGTKEWLATDHSI
jgi:hypothetical protein